MRLCALACFADTDSPFAGCFECVFEHLKTPIMHLIQHFSSVLYFSQEEKKEIDWSVSPKCCANCNSWVTGILETRLSKFKNGEADLPAPLRFLENKS